MTPICNNKGRQPSNDRAFTIMEVLMVLGVIGLALTLFIINVERAIQGIIREAPTETFRNAVRTARLSAVNGRTAVSLEFDAEETTFLLKDVSGREFTRFEIDPTDQEYVQAFVFWPILPRSVRSGSYPEYRRSSTPSQKIVFEPTGVASFVTVELRYHPGYSDSLWMVLDPFSDGLLEINLR